MEAITIASNSHQIRDTLKEQLRELSSARKRIGGGLETGSHVDGGDCRATVSVSRGLDAEQGPPTLGDVDDWQIKHNNRRLVISP